MCTPSSHQLDLCRGGSTHQFFNSSVSGASSLKQKVSETNIEMRRLWQVSCRCTPLTPCFWENPSAKMGEGGWSRGQVFCVKCCSSHFWRHSLIETSYNHELGGGMLPGHSRDTSMFWLALPRLMSEPPPLASTVCCHVTSLVSCHWSKTSVASFPQLHYTTAPEIWYHPPCKKGGGIWSHAKGVSGTPRMWFYVLCAPLASINLTLAEEGPRINSSPPQWVVRLP